MSFRLVSPPAYQTDFDLWSIAERNGLKPRGSSNRIKFFCPVCDAGGASRAKGPTASGAPSEEFGPWHCFRSSCEASGTARSLAAFFGEIEDVEKPRPLIRARPAPPPKPKKAKLDVEKAWKDLQTGSTSESLERLLFWCRSRGWSDSVAQAVVLSDEVAFANPRLVSGPARKLAESAARVGRELIVPIRDARGIARSAVRRWIGGSENAPRPKSLSLPTSLVGPGEDWGGVWAFGSIPAAIQAAAAGEPIYLVEGAPDFLALVGLLISEGLPGAVVGFYQIQTAPRVVKALVSGLGDLGIIADRVVLIPHNDTLSAAEIEKGETTPIGLRIAEVCADLLRGRSGVFMSEIPEPFGDFSDLLKGEPERVLPLLRVARCVHQKPVPLAEAPEEMVHRFARAILEATNKVSSGRRSLVVFQVPMGVGKTYTAIKAAAKVVIGEFQIPINGRRPSTWPASKPWPPKERSVVFCVPDHGLADEKIDELAEIAPGTRARHIYGLLNYCAFADNVRPVYPSVGRRGICGPTSIKGDDRDVQRCPHRNACPGASDPKAFRGEVTFSPHALLGSVPADLVIVDESPGVIVTSETEAEEITSLFACKLIPRVLSWRRYRNPAAGDAAALLARAVQSLAIAHAKQVGAGESEPYSRRIWGEDLMKLIDSEPGLAAELAEGFSSEAMAPPVPSPAEVRSGHHALNHMPSRPAFAAMAALSSYYQRLKNPPEPDPLGLAVEPPAPMCAIRLDTSGAWTLEVRKIQKLPEAPVVVLDATGHLTIAEWQAAYPDRNVAIRSLEVQGAAPARALHLDTNGFTRRSIISGDGSIKPDAAKRVLKVLEAVAKETRAVRSHNPGEAPTRIGLLSHMPLVAAMRGQGPGAKSDGGKAILDAMEKLKGRGFSFEGQTGGSLLGWYGRHDRGTNVFEAVDGLIVIGVPWGDVGALDADAILLGLKPAEIAAARAAATCQQAIARARHIRRDAADRVVLIFAGTTPPDLPGVVWHKERLPGGRRADETSLRVVDLFWHIAREVGVIGLPVLKRFDRAGSRWADLAPSDVSLSRRRRGFDKVARSLKWTQFQIKTKTGRITLAAPSLVNAEAWAEKHGFISILERKAPPF